RGGGAQAWTYSYSTTPNRRWHEARKWCHQHLTNMVTIQTPEETDFINNLLPFNQKYYWIGIHKVDGVWTREGNNETVLEDVQNWAPKEPDNIVGQDCVEIYIKRDKDTAKWNNEKCQSKKGTVCYSASCTQDSCSAHADCVETVGNYTCQCHPGFHGPRCEEEQGSHYCFHPYGSNRFNSSCRFHCELGFRLLGSPQLLCQTSGHWNNPVPLCQVVQCNSLEAPPHASVQCQDPLGVYSYGSICTVQCEEGFDLIGTNMTQCSSQGSWSHTLPVCQAKRCPALNSTTYGSLFCFDPHGEFSFGSQCTSTCEEGFLLNGTADTVCTSLGTWSADIPHCLAKRCPTLNSPPHGSFSCYDPHGEFNFGSRCTSTCEEGFLLNGTANTDCTSVGKWSRDVPRCLAKRCPTLNSPPHGSSSCSAPHGEFSFGSRCTSACEEGFVLSGTADTECTSVGTWSTDTPRCLAKKCPSLNSPAHGSSSCSDPHGEFSFGSRCTSTCEEGFVLNGTADTECTSLGTWSTETPHCLGKRKTRPCPLLAEAPQHGRMNCSHPFSPFSLNSSCGFECNEGFWLRGTPTMTCRNSGHWSQDLPTCQRESSSLPLSMNCSHPLGHFSFGSQCLFTCTGGFSLNGTDVLLCSSAGFWSDSLPNCTEATPVGAAMLMNSGAGAASVLVPLLLIGLGFLALFILTRSKKRGESFSNDGVQLHTYTCTML
uniref:Selectin P n=1 Tax=Seriola dumerili TaxID=41447 RepID=A0A3B4TZA5_SERDU